MADDQSQWVGSFEVKTFDVLGAQELQPVVQGMANRLGIGAQRYGRAQSRTNAGDDTRPRDMIDTAILRAEVAWQEGNREGLLDAMNFLFLAYRKMPHHEPSESSPGVVHDGVIGGARGVHEPTNGSRFERGAQAPVVRPMHVSEAVDLVYRYVTNVHAIAEHRYDDIITNDEPTPILPQVNPSDWTTPAPESHHQVRHYTGGPLRHDVI